MSEQEFIKVKVYKMDNMWVVSDKVGYRKHFHIWQKYPTFKEALRNGRELCMDYGCELIVEREIL